MLYLPFVSGDHIERDFKALTQYSINPYERSNHSKEYDVEKKDIKEKLTTYYESIRLSKSKEKQIEMFVEVLKKYENIQELDAKLLNELIKQIVVYERELKEDGRTQRIEIEYNFLN